MQQPNNNIILCIIIIRALYYEITKLRSLKQALNLHILLTFFRVKFWKFAAVNINICVIWNMETFRLAGVYRDFKEYPAP
jgi:hypothetical protein